MWSIGFWLMIEWLTRWPLLWVDKGAKFRCHGLKIVLQTTNQFACNWRSPCWQVAETWGHNSYIKMFIHRGLTIKKCLIQSVAVNISHRQIYLIFLTGYILSKAHSIKSGSVSLDMENLTHAQHGVTIYCVNLCPCQMWRNFNLVRSIYKWYILCAFTCVKYVSRFHFISWFFHLFFPRLSWWYMWTIVMKRLICLLSWLCFLYATEKG